MKKLFTLFFLVSVLGPALFSGNIVTNKEMKETITKTVKTEIEGNYAPKHVTFGSEDPTGLINVIQFRQNIYNAPSKYSDGNKYVEDLQEGECIAIAIDESWAVASKKCLLAKGEKMKPIPGTVGSSSASNFKIIVSGKTYTADNYKVGNVFLLRVVNEKGTPIFLSAPKAGLAFVKSSDESEFKNNFEDGYFEVDITDKHTSAYADFHNAYEDNFHSYLGVGRKSYKKEVKEVYKDDKTKDILAQVKSAKLRAGDPLFYIENGNKYLLGFANATNLWDNFDNDNTRTNKVILLAESDKQEIISKINSVDPVAGKRIEKSILAK